MVKLFGLGVGVNFFLVVNICCKDCLIFFFVKWFDFIVLAIVVIIVIGFGGIKRIFIFVFKVCIVIFLGLVMFVIFFIISVLVIMMLLKLSFCFNCLVKMVGDKVVGLLLF